MRLGRRGWVLGMLLGLLGGWHAGQAADFMCPAGDVACLKAAITTANGNGDVNTITLAAGTYALTTVDNTIEGPNGLPSITGVLTLRGAGAETTRLARVFTDRPCSRVEPPFRLLHVAPTGVLTLKGLTLQGGCITRLDDPSGSGSGGGGLFNQGTVSLLQSAIVQNGTVNRVGAGMHSHGPLTVIDSTIAENEAAGEGAGGIDSDGPLTVTHSRIADNFGDSAGGIAAGGVTVIAHNSIEENMSYYSGGILNDGTMDITESTIAHNWGGFSSGTGGIRNDTPESTLTIVNSTIAENESLEASSGLSNWGGTLTIVNSTIARNHTVAPAFFFGDTSAGLGNLPSVDTPPLIGTVTLQNTLVAQNTFEEPPSSSNSGGPDCGGPLTSLGTNLIGDSTNCTLPLQANDRTGDPGLDAFTPGDGTPGHGHISLLATSRAIDAGNNAACPLLDQMGQPRVGRCDIGAIEFQPSAGARRN